MQKIITLITILFLATKVLEAQEYKLHKTINYNGTSISYLIFGLQDYLFVGNTRGNLELMRLDGTLLKRLNSHSKKITEITFSKNQQMMASASYDGTICLWDTQNFSLKHTFTNSSVTPYNGTQGNEPTFVQFSQDNRTLYYGGYNRNVIQADLISYETHSIFNNQKYGIVSGKITPTNLLVGLGGKVNVLNLEDLQVAYEVGNHINFKDYVCEIVINPRNINQWAYWTVKGTIHIYNQRNYMRSIEATNLEGSSMLSFSNDGKYITSANSQKVMIWNVDTGRVKQILRHTNKITVLAFNSSDTYLACADGNQIKLWKKNTDDILEYDNLEVGDIIIMKKILFQRGSYMLPEEAKKEINKLAEQLTNHRNLKIEISGHTDNVGTLEGNQNLSKNRVISIKHYLITRGVNETQLSTAAYGSSKPIAPNDSEENRAKNRRVEIKILRI